MDRVSEGLLAEMGRAVRIANTKGFWEARKKLEALWDEREAAVGLLSATDPLEEVCTVREAAERLAAGQRTVYRRVESGELRGRKSGGVWLVLLPLAEGKEANGE